MNFQNGCANMDSDKSESSIQSDDDLAAWLCTFLLKRTMNFRATYNVTKEGWDICVKSCNPSISDELSIGVHGEYEFRWDVGYMFDCFPLDGKGVTRVRNAIQRANDFFDGELICIVYVDDGVVKSGTVCRKSEIDAWLRPGALVRQWTQ
jgi:hypothetical protein